MGKGRLELPRPNASPGFADYSVPDQGQSTQPRINPSLDAHHTLAEALRSLADTADALRRLAEVLETPSQINLPTKESHQNGASSANGAVLPFT